MNSIQKVIFWSAILLSRVAADNHCIVGGCPVDNTGHQLHCGYYMVVDISTYQSMSTDDFIAQSREECIRDADCNQLVAGASGQGIYKYCPGMECPPYQRMDRELRKCTSDVCTAGQTLQTDGTCVGCPPYEQLQPGGGCQNVCSSAQGQIVLQNGQCQGCPPFSKPQFDAVSRQYSRCGPASCSSDQILMISGDCFTCQPPQVPDQQKRRCESNRVACGARESTSPDGSQCFPCPEYTRAQNMNAYCAANACGSSMYIMRDGTCSACQSGFEPDSSNQNRSCRLIRATCTGPRQIYSPDGLSCLPCGPYTRAQQGNTVCRANPCRSNEIVDFYGSCIACPFNQVPDASRQNCISIEAVCSGPREKYSPDRTSCVTCEPYTRAQNNNQYCAPDNCGPDQQIDFDGRCSFCPPYSAVSPDGRGCAEPVCFGRDVIDVTGTCRACTPYTRPNLPDRKSCGQDNCGANSKLTQDGTCEFCPSGTTVSPDKRFCNVNVKAPESKDRIKLVQLMSISPLDRLLNQRDRNDNIMVQVTCKGVTGTPQMKDYDFDIDRAQINRLTCWDGSQPKAGEKCPIESNEFTECGPGESYTVEMFDLAQQRIQKTTNAPSIGQFTITKEMMECMVEDRLQIHFEYGKRQQVAGAVACFDHVPYIRQTERNIWERKWRDVEDEIPFTPLNICHKNAVSRRRCFLYAYQITIFIRDSEQNANYPLIQPVPYVRIRFNKISDKLIILPQDQVKIRFVSSYTDQEALRLQPMIYSNKMPEPLKRRYQIPYTDGTPGFYTRIPCDDMKVADSIHCENLEAYCTKPTDKIMFSIQGSGDMFLVEEKCSDFLAGYQDWNKLQFLLTEDFQKFQETFTNSDKTLKKFPMDGKIKFQNRWSIKQEKEGWLEFEYEIGWKMQTREPRCFAGDHLTAPKASCDFYCADKQCILERPHDQNRDNRRMLELQTQIAGSDILGPSYYIDPTTGKNPPLPLKIPTRSIAPSGIQVPEKLLDLFLNNYKKWSTLPTRTNLIQQEELLVEEQVEVVKAAKIEEIEEVKGAKIEVEENVETEKEQEVEAEEEEEEEEEKVEETHSHSHEEKISPISLLASFDGNIGPAYTYSINDKVELNNQPPAAVEITKLPEKGQLVSYQYGEERVVEVGDVVPPGTLKYNQGTDGCSIENELDCKDTFSFIPYSSWQGRGTQSKSFIKLNPVTIEEETGELDEVEQLQPVVVEEIQPVKPQVEIEETSPKVEKESVEQTQHEPVAAYDENPECNVEFPNTLVAAMVISIITLMGASGGLIYCLFCRKTRTSFKYEEKELVKFQSPSNELGELNVKQESSVFSQKPMIQPNFGVSDFNSQVHLNQNLPSQGNALDVSESTIQQSPDKLVAPGMMDEEAQRNEYSIQLRLSKFDDQSSQQESSARSSSKNGTIRGGFAQETQQPQSLDPAQNVQEQTMKEKDVLVEEITAGIRQLSLITERERNLRSEGEKNKVFEHLQYIEQQSNEKYDDTFMDESPIRAKLDSEQEEE